MSSAATVYRPRAAATSGQSRSRWRPALSKLFWCLPVLLAGLCFWQALPAAQHPAESTATASIAPSAVQQGIKARNRTLVTRPIQDIHVGQRVLADNPELRGIEVPQVAIDPDTTQFADAAKLARMGPFDITKYRPIEVIRQAGRMRIQEGMTRVEAAVRAGWTHLEAFVFDR